MAHALLFLLLLLPPLLLLLPDVCMQQQVSIEVGMQNSALAVVLARSAFPDPLTALPGAISATVHSLLGSGLAAVWRARGGGGGGGAAKAQ